MNRRVVFAAAGHGATSSDRRCRYALLAAALLASNIVWMTALTEFGIPLLLAKIATEIVLFVTSYGVQKSFVFASQDRPGDSRPEPVIGAQTPHSNRIAAPGRVESDASQPGEILMTVTTFALIGIDLAAALLLSLGLYYRRHHRRDLVVAFLGVNVGVLAVAAVLGTAEVALGLGLGLFGVLSIIRLRSSEISQREVAYYFAALAMGLMAGLPQTDPWPVTGLIALILVVMWAADHPRAARPQPAPDRARSTARSPTRPSCATSWPRGSAAQVLSVIVQELDLVNDTTLVDVRYRVAARRPRAPRTTLATSVGGIR